MASLNRRWNNDGLSRGKPQQSSSSLPPTLQASASASHWLNPAGSQLIREPRKRGAWTAPVPAPGGAGPALFTRVSSSVKRDDDLACPIVSLGGF